jgi:hypothetical protein
MGAAATAIGDPNDGIQSCVKEWQRRRDVPLDELCDFVAIPPHGGWSFESLEILIAGACNRRYLQLWSGAA